jgi:AcrR family transcriptional regulator
MRASQNLLAANGLEGVSIQDITEEADVGLGTFYNHFKSKSDVVKALADEYLEEYTSALEPLLADIEDPAEVISVSYRYTLAQALDKKSFPILQQVPAIYLREKITLRAYNDVEAGRKSGRFEVDNVKSLMICVRSMLLGVMECYAQGILNKKEAEHTAVYFLRLLGISEKEANILASKSMPNLRRRFVSKKETK